MDGQTDNTVSRVAFLTENFPFVYRNVAKFFSHLLHTDAIGWEVLQVIKLNEDDTTSSSRIFIKLLFQELAEFLGMTKLVER